MPYIGFGDNTHSSTMTLTNNGQVQVNSGGTLFMRNSTLNGSGGGTTTIDSGGQLLVNGYSTSARYWSYLSGDLVNDGTIQLQTYGKFSHTGDLSGSGSYLLTGDTIIDGDFTLGSAGVGHIAVSNSKTVTLSGNLGLQLIDETDFVWGTNSELLMTGGVGATEGIWGNWARLEIGGLDGGVGGSYDNNFDMYKLALDGSAHIYLADWYNNGNRSSSEALYLDYLTLASGSVLNLNELNLYVGGSQIFAGAYDSGMVINSAVPEPASLLLLGSGLFGLGFLKRRKYLS